MLNLTTAVPVDFHTHLDWYKNRKTLLTELKEFNGIIIASSVDHKSYVENCRIRQEAETSGSNALIIPTAGIHPLSAGNLPEDLDLVYKDDLMSSPILGEIGMDFLWHRNVPEFSQERAFRYFMSHAERYSKYCVIHTKDAEEKICNILKDYPNAKPVIHWYNGPESVYREFLDRGYMFTFGVETARNPYLQKLLRLTPLEKILAETDNPDSEIWLGGTECDIRLIEKVYRQLAAILGLSYDQLVKALFENVLKIFNSSGMTDRKFQN